MFKPTSDFRGFSPDTEAETTPTPTQLPVSSRKMLKVVAQSAPGGGSTPNKKNLFLQNTPNEKTLPHRGTPKSAKSLAVKPPAHNTPRSESTPSKQMNEELSRSADGVMASTAGPTSDTSNNVGKKQEQKSSKKKKKRKQNQEETLSPPTTTAVGEESKSIKKRKESSSDTPSSKDDNKESKSSKKRKEPSPADTPSVKVDPKLTGAGEKPSKKLKITPSTTTTSKNAETSSDKHDKQSSLKTPTAITSNDNTKDPASSTNGSTKKHHNPSNALIVPNPMDEEHATRTRIATIWGEKYANAKYDIQTFTAKRLLDEGDMSSESEDEKERQRLANEVRARLAGSDTKGRGQGYDDVVLAEAARQAKKLAEYERTSARRREAEASSIERGSGDESEKEKQRSKKRKRDGKEDEVEVEDVVGRRHVAGDFVSRLLPLVTVVPAEMIDVEFKGRDSSEHERVSAIIKQETKSERKRLRKEKKTGLSRGEPPVWENISAAAAVIRGLVESKDEVCALYVDVVVSTAVNYMTMMRNRVKNLEARVQVLRQ